MNGASVDLSEHQKMLELFWSFISRVKFHEMNMIFLTSLVPNTKQVWVQQFEKGAFDAKQEVTIRCDILLPKYLVSNLNFYPPFFLLCTR